VTTIWQGLFHGSMAAAEFPVARIPLPAAWIALLAMCGICLLVLDKKLAAYEVVR
jgi:hypothetical protein